MKSKTIFINIILILAIAGLYEYKIHRLNQELITYQEGYDNLNWLLASVNKSNKNQVLSLERELRLCQGKPFVIDLVVKKYNEGLTEKEERMLVKHINNKEN
jgi:hypothetical protein